MLGVHLAEPDMNNGLINKASNANIGLARQDQATPLWYVYTQYIYV